MSQKKHKVIVIGLPKTGTSTLAVMLRVLDYKVTGPEIDFEVNNEVYLENKFLAFDGFQDFPWCFEWERFANCKQTKFIILHREFESWWKSFYESYGHKNERYLSYPYMNILKIEENKKEFFNFFNSYYQNAKSFSESHPNQVINVNINTLKWEDICGFLDEKLPKNIFGKVSKQPHVNKYKAKTRRTIRFKIQKNIKTVLLTVLGQKTYLNLITILRKNNFI